MKKFFVLVLALASAGIFNSAFAQCTPPAPTGEGGWTPKWPCFPCIEQGVAFAEVLSIEIPDSIASFPLQQVTLESISNVPSGISYTIQPGNVIAGGGTACLDITGTTTDSVQDYKVGIYVSINIPGFGNIPNTELGALIQQLDGLGLIPDDFDVTSFDYYLRVIAPGGTCTIDDSCSVGIKSLSNVLTELTVQPNPMTTQTQVSWNSTVSGDYTAQIFDVVGKEVFSKKLQVHTGSNSLTIERGELAAGSYVFILTDGRKSTSAKLMVRE